MRLGHKGVNTIVIFEWLGGGDSVPGRGALLPCARSALTIPLDLKTGPRQEALFDVALDPVREFAVVFEVAPERALDRALARHEERRIEAREESALRRGAPGRRRAR